jgi:hypothetical protein
VENPLPAVLQEFGEFTVPALLGMYSHLIKPEWRTLDVIEHAESVHGAVRLQERGAAPPYLSTRRVNPHKLILTHTRREKCAPSPWVWALAWGNSFRNRHRPAQPLHVPRRRPLRDQLHGSLTKRLAPLMISHPSCPK